MDLSSSSVIQKRDFTHYRVCLHMWDYNLHGITMKITWHTTYTNHTFGNNLELLPSGNIFQGWENGRVIKEISTIIRLPRAWLKGTIVGRASLLTLLSPPVQKQKGTGLYQSVVIWPRNYSKSVTINRSRSLLLITPIHSQGSEVPNPSLSPSCSQEHLSPILISHGVNSKNTDSSG